jgi:hypothetical protein
MLDHFHTYLRFDSNGYMITHLTPEEGTKRQQVLTKKKPKKEQSFNCHDESVIFSQPVLMEPIWGGLGLGQF